MSSITLGMRSQKKKPQTFNNTQLPPSRPRAAFAMGSVFNLLSLWFLRAAEVKSAGDARKVGVEEEMCEMKGKK